MERTSLKKVESLICTQSSPGGIKLEEEESDHSKEGVFSLWKLSKPEKPYSSFKSSNDNNENYTHTHTHWISENSNFNLFFWKFSLLPAFNY